MRQTLLVLMLLCIGIKGHSQNFVKGSVTDSTQAPIPFCPLALMNASDSSLAKGNVSDSLGRFIFEHIKPGNYFIKFSNVGYAVTTTAAFPVDSQSQIEFTPQLLRAEGVNLTEVSVVVNKPAIEFQKGMVVMNVENDLLAKGNTVLELLKRIPGVIVDAQNNITINGIGGARFLLDDRLQQMPAPQVIDMLSSMSADAVSKIELIKNPPARYDAAGTGGLINIVTKKAKVKGYNGSVVWGTSQGKRFRTGPFVSFNYKNNKLSIFSSLSYGYWEGLSVTQLDRKLIGSGQTENINSTGTQAAFQRVVYGNAGLEYDITPKLLLGLYVNGNANNDFYNGKTTTEIGNSTDFDYGRLEFTTRDEYKIISPNYNLSLMQKIDSTGGQVKFNAGYNNYLEKNTKLNRNYFYDASGMQVTDPSTYNNYADRNFKVYTQKLDMNKTFRNKLSLEAGLKANFVDNYNKNELQFSNQSTGLFEGDTTFYNNFRYKERILAAYSTFARSWEKFGFSLGLRAEDTDQRATDLKTGYKFGRNYFNVFPSGSMDFTLNKKNQVTAAYSYRIDRPHYGMLNPVRMFNEQLNYSAGNPEIRPQFTHNINIDHNYNQFITQSIGIDKTKDFTFWYSYTPDSSKVNVDTIANMKDRINAYYSISAQKRIKWYNFQTYAVIMYRTFTGELSGQSVNSKTLHYYMNLNQEFFLPKDFKIQLWAGFGSGFYDGPQYYYPRSAIHISVNKGFMDNKLNIMLGLFDALYLDYFRYEQKFPTQQFYYKDKPDTRRVRITINYRFGKMQFQQRMNAESDSRIKTGK